MEATGLLQKRLEEDICDGNAGQGGEEEVYFYFFLWLGKGQMGFSSMLWGGFAAGRGWGC